MPKNESNRVKFDTVSCLFMADYIHIHTLQKEEKERQIPHTVCRTLVTSNPKIF